MAQTVTSSAGQSVGARRLQRLMFVAAAVVGAVVVWGIATAAGVKLLQPAQGTATPMELGVGMVIFASAFATLAGWGLLALLEKFVGNPRRTWTIVAVIFLVLSFGGPLTGTGVTTANRLVLLAMHIVVGAIFIPLMARSAHGSRPA